MKNAETKARELCQCAECAIRDCCVDKETGEYNNCCGAFQCVIDMHEWTMEQVEDKMVQVIICAQQGYTQGAPDDVVKKHCMEILNDDEL